MGRRVGSLTLSQGQSEWQLAVLGTIDGPVQHGLLQETIRQALREAEPARAAFFEIDGQVFRKPIDCSDIELPFHLFRNFQGPLGGRPAKFALFRTRAATIYSAMVSGHPIPPAYFGLFLPPQSALDYQPGRWPG